MKLNEPYLNEHQLPSDLPFLQMMKLLGWRLGNVAVVSLVVAFFSALVLLGAKWPTLAIVLIGAPIVALVGLWFLSYPLHESRDRWLKKGLLVNAALASWADKGDAATPGTGNSFGDGIKKPQ